MRSVFVLDGSQRSALAVTRSLGRRGVDVCVGDVAESSLAGASRFCSRRFAYPDPARHPSDFVNSILSASPRESGDLILPMTDVTTMLLVADGRLRHRLISAPREAYEALADKANLIARATALGIPVPQTIVAQNERAARRALQDLGYPAVIKPARSRYLHGGCVHSTSVSLVTDPATADATLKRAEWLQHIPALIQRFIPGTGAGLFALTNHGEPVAWFAHQRLREKPPSGGVSVLCQAVATDPALVAMSSGLLRSVAWNGVAMVEFRRAANGDMYLMEVNGRFWGSLQLAIDAGVDFPWLLYNCTLGATHAAVRSYATGGRLHWFLGDLDNLLIQLRNKDLSRSTFERAHAVSSFLATCVSPSARPEVFRATDPLPAMFELADWIKSTFQR